MMRVNNVILFIGLVLFGLASVECCIGKHLTVVVLARPSGDQSRDFFLYVFPWLAEHLSPSVTFKIHIWTRLESRHSQDVETVRALRLMCSLDLLQGNQLTQSKYLSCQYMLPDPDDRRCINEYLNSDGVEVCVNSAKGKRLARAADRALRRCTGDLPQLHFRKNRYVNPSLRSVVQEICREVSKRSRKVQKRAPYLVAECDKMAQEKARVLLVLSRFFKKF